IRRYKWISENYFETMGNPILAGRTITWADIYNRAPVVMITENLAREYWKDPAAAVGRRVKQSPPQPWREIIGVVGNEHDDGVSQEATATVYWPMLISRFWDEGIYGRRTTAYAIRTHRSGTSALLREVQQAVWSINPNLPLADVRTLDEILERSMARTSFTLVMLAIAAGVALLLGIIGIYGVISYSASQRRREIGIRIALGAQRAEVSGLFVRHALRLTAIGLALGLGAAVGLTRLMSALLFGVNALDPLTFGGVAVLLGAAALLASYLPARRASGLDPVDALRRE
ncbi:MAG: FtsX-like permease family protein, partial [Acidobacteriota bacterium]